jgi:hypothetical protein
LAVEIPLHTVAAHGSKHLGLLFTLHTFSNEVIPRSFAMAMTCWIATIPCSLVVRSVKKP